MLRWLAPKQGWAIHPMYFPRTGENRIDAFPCEYAHFLGISCVDGNIWDPGGLADAVAGWTGDLFLDPDTGLWQNASDIRHVGVHDLIAIAQADTRKHQLTLVYDQSLNRDHKIDGSPREQIENKLEFLRAAKIHAAAYVSHIAFLWVSTDHDVVSAATQNVLQRSRLPICCFVDDGCGHFR